MAQPVQRVLQACNNKKVSSHLSHKYKAVELVSMTLQKTWSRILNLDALKCALERQEYHFWLSSLACGFFDFQIHSGSQTIWSVEQHSSTKGLYNGAAAPPPWQPSQLLKGGEQSHSYSFEMYSDRMRTVPFYKHPHFPFWLHDVLTEDRQIKG